MLACPSMKSGAKGKLCHLGNLTSPSSAASGVNLCSAGGGATSDRLYGFGQGIEVQPRLGLDFKSHLWPTTSGPFSSLLCIAWGRWAEPPPSHGHQFPAFTSHFCTLPVLWTLFVFRSKHKHFNVMSFFFFCHFKRRLFSGNLDIMYVLNALFEITVQSLQSVSKVPWYSQLGVCPDTPD